VILFIQKTWFLWWILASVVILRWFHLFSSSTHETALEAVDSGEEEACTASNQILSGKVGRLSA
jgi:hypothetical protein